MERENESEKRIVVFNSFKDKIVIECEESGYEF